MKKILFLLPLILALLVSGTVEAKKKKYPNGDYYEGEWKKGMPNGFGKMIYANGNIYEGEWKEGKFYGTGKMKYANGNVYEGHWVTGDILGEGKMTYANSDVYEGTWLDGEILNGVGSIKYANGNIFHGEWELHQPIRGKMVYTDGSVYDGTWQDGILYTGTSQGGNIDEGFYNGKWVAGKFYEGNCQGYIADSLWYDGELKEGKLTNGSCNGYIADSLWYNGELKNGKIVKGKCKGYINGNYYDGEWINDFFIGSCKLKAINKKDIVSFEGTISTDTIMNGKVVYKNGNSYTGELKNYLREGKGRMSLDGIVISGIWKKDILISGTGNITDNMAESYSFIAKRVSSRYNIQVKNIFGYQVQLQNTAVSTVKDLVINVQDIIENQLSQQTARQRQLAIAKQEQAEEARMQSKLKYHRGENYGIGKMTVTNWSVPETKYLYKFGDAEFQYYPTAHKDVLYGNFHVWNGKYWGSDASFSGEILYSAQGKFKNGVKTGTWIFEERDKWGRHLHRRLTINYKNGIKSGLATLETYGEMGSNSIIKAYYNNDQWEKRGTTYYYYNKAVFESWLSTDINTSITERRVSFDNNGNLHGDIYMREDDVELKERYEHGKLISSEKRNIKKGIVLSPKRGENRFDDMWELILPAAYPIGSYTKYSYRVDNDALIGMTFMNFEENSELDQKLVDRLKEESNK